MCSTKGSTHPSAPVPDHFEEAQNRCRWKEKIWTHSAPLKGFDWTQLNPAEDTDPSTKCSQFKQMFVSVGLLKGLGLGLGLGLLKEEQPKSSVCFKQRIYWLIKLRLGSFSHNGSVVRVHFWPASCHTGSIHLLTLPFNFFSNSCAKVHALPWLPNNLHKLTCFFMLAYQQSYEIHWFVHFALAPQTNHSRTGLEPDPHGSHLSQQLNTPGVCFKPTKHTKYIQTPSESKEFCN